MSVREPPVREPLVYCVLRGLGIRNSPDVRDAYRTGHSVDAGAIVSATQRVRGYGGHWYVRLEDGRGWLFETKGGESMLEAVRGSARPGV